MAAAQPNTAAQLEKLGELRENRVITDTEFSQQKAKVLA
jgi:hypothetical protein